ncbi:hypothetical protein PM082_022922 [Marasmius tenuissimus]|nr:hypothetical protein PM082_022922 [Marasmius tenuissimus]
MADITWVAEFGIAAALDEMLKNMPDLILGKHSPSVWVANDPVVPEAKESKEQYEEYISRLSMPALHGTSQAPVMIHNLGSLAQNPVLESRIDGIFSGENTFLVNASGTGKSRLLYEGLVRRWGFYLTCAVDDTGIGSRELFNTIQSYLRDTKGFTTIFPDDDSAEVGVAHSRNSLIARRTFSIILLARVLIFRRFLQISGELGDHNEADLKRTWLIYQLFYPIHSFDPFLQLFSVIWRCDVEEPAIGDAISTALAEIYRLHGVSEIYLALDEANYATRSLSHVFRSEDGTYYPLLKELLVAWTLQVKKFAFTFVVAGTEIPTLPFTEDIWKKWKWSSDTGAFNERASQTNWVLEYFPPQMRENPSIHELSHRIWRWLRGRHRSTAAMVATFLSNKFLQPHLLLDSFVFEISRGYVPYDAHAPRGGVYRLSYSAIPFSYIEKLNDPLIMSCIHQTLLSYLLRSNEQPEFPATAVSLVSSTFGHFTDAHCSRIAVDEPIVIAGSANFLCQAPRSVVNLDYFGRVIYSQQVTPIHLGGYLAICMALVLGKPQVPTSPTFHFVLPAAWTRSSLSLNIYRRQGQKLSELPFKYLPGSLKPIVTYTDTPDDFLSWIQFKYETPFCIYTPTDKSATLIFRIKCKPKSKKLGKSRRAWVFMKGMPYCSENLNEEEFESTVKHIADSILPRNLFSDDPTSRDKLLSALRSLPSLERNVGSSGVLRVLMPFRGVDRRLSDILHRHGTPESALAMVNSINAQKSLAEYPPEEIRDTIIKVATSEEDPGKKRKRMSSASSEAGSSVNVERPPRKKATISLDEPSVRTEGLHGDAETEASTKIAGLDEISAEDSGGRVSVVGDESWLSRNR